MEFLNEILVTLTRNKWRSVMTMFGVFWGIWMLIVLSGIGKGITNGIVPDADKLPTNVAFFMPSQTTMPYRGFQKSRTWRLDTDDMAAVEQRLGKKCRFVGGIVWADRPTFSRGEYHGDYQVRGVMPSFTQTQPMQLLYGRFVNDVDIREKRKVVVIGEDIYKTLFPEGGDPCGTYVQAGSLYYMVIGVMRQTSNMMNIGGSIRNSALLPLTTVQQNYHRGNEIDFLIMMLHDQYSVKENQETVNRLIKQRHLVNPDDKGASWAMNVQELFDTFQMLFLGINILLWIVGLGTLFAGLIGISNIMLVTVKERTQEIGVRRAIGAKPRIILSQIVSESVLLTSIAGILGLVAGVWCLTALDIIFSANASSDGFSLKDPQISFGLAASALLIIIIGGLAAGIMPAMRAMRIKAIDALRDE